MKKVLFATSALVALAGAASAEVAVSGDGRMGMIYDGEDIQFSSRARAKFTMTGTSDSGLEFGGAFRVDQESDYTAGYDGSGRSAARGSWTRSSSRSGRLSTVSQPRSSSVWQAVRRPAPALVLKV